MSEDEAKKAPNRFSLDERCIALMLREQGKDNDEIGAHLGRSEHSVRVFFNNWDFRNPPPASVVMLSHLEEQLANFIRPLYVQQGLGMQAILAKVNVWRANRGMKPMDIDGVYRIVNAQAMKRPRVIPGLRRA